jgi:putative transposase
VTWRLAGTLLTTRLAIGDGRDFAEQDRLLDRAASGPAWLREAAIAACVVHCIRDGEGREYDLKAFVVMPNHVHLLITPGIELARITRRIKGGSARRANSILGRTGQAFWQDESFDHWVRDAREFERLKSYIERNPVKAGLVDAPEQWPYSSAARVQAEHRLKSVPH